MARVGRQLLAFVLQVETYIHFVWVRVSLLCYSFIVMKFTPTQQKIVSSKVEPLGVPGQLALPLLVELLCFLSKRVPSCCAEGLFPASCPLHSFLSGTVAGRSIESSHSFSLRFIYLLHLCSPVAVMIEGVRVERPSFVPPTLRYLNDTCPRCGCT